MDEFQLNSIKVRTDLVGDYDKRDSLKGFKAECFLKKVLKQNEEIVLERCKHWGLAPFIQYLANNYVVKYAKYLKDKEARQHIYEKYAEKQSTVDILCGHLSDLSAEECLKLEKELHLFEKAMDSNDSVISLVDTIISNNLEKLKAIIPDDTNKVRNMN